MLEFLRQSWAWYASGAAIALVMVLLLYYGKSFGFSSNFRTICTISGAGKSTSFFDFDWKTQRWNLLFLVGSVLGGIIAATVLKGNAPLELSPATISDLSRMGIGFNGDLNPASIYGWDFASTVKGFLVLAGGGFLVGFGSRYAGGCTSGHAISGLSNLQRPSLLAVLAFFAGGLIMTHILMPLIF